MAPAGTSTTEGFRGNRVGNLSGPGSSYADYQATQDMGKTLAAGSSGAYRRTGDAAGPTSSHADYKPTQGTFENVSLWKSTQRSYTRLHKQILASSCLQDRYKPSNTDSQQTALIRKEM